MLGSKTVVKVCTWNTPENTNEHECQLFTHKRSCYRLNSKHVISIRLLLPNNMLQVKLNTHTQCLYGTCLGFSLLITAPSDYYTLLCCMTSSFNQQRLRSCASALLSVSVVLPSKYTILAIFVLLVSFPQRNKPHIKICTCVIYCRLVTPVFFWKPATVTYSTVHNVNQAVADPRGGGAPPPFHCPKKKKYL